MPTYANCGIGEVHMTGNGGYGFNIVNERDRPLLYIEYPTREEADAARAVIADVLRGAAIITYPS